MGSKFSQWLTRKTGLPEVNLRKHPLTAPLLAPLLGTVTPIIDAIEGMEGADKEAALRFATAKGLDESFRKMPLTTVELIRAAAQRRIDAEKMRKP